MNLTKFPRTPFLKKQLWWLPLKLSFDFIQGDFLLNSIKLHHKKIVCTLFLSCNEKSHVMSKLSSTPDYQWKCVLMSCISLIHILDYILFQLFLSQYITFLDMIQKWQILD